MAETKKQTTGLSQTPELSQPQQEAQKEVQTQQRQVSSTRAQRRGMMKQQGILKYLSSLPPMGEIRSRVRSENIINGKKMHQQHVDAMEAKNAKYLETVLEGLKASWTTQGFNAEEIKTLEEAWALTAVKDKANYRADKKASKKLYKEARASLASRQK